MWDLAGKGIEIRMEEKRVELVGPVRGEGNRMGKLEPVGGV